jgi:hypothetical protein
VTLRARLLTCVALPVAIGCVVGFALSGCAPRESVGPAAPSSSLSYDTALGYARMFARFTGTEVGTLAPSGSMLPLIGSNAVVLLEPVTRPAVGDIVTFQRDGRSIIHRVTAVDPTSGMVRTRGDNNDASDYGWQQPRQRVVAIIYASR